MSEVVCKECGWRGDYDDTETMMFAQEDSDEMYESNTGDCPECGGPTDDVQGFD